MGASCPTWSAGEIVDDHRLAYVSEAPVNWCPGLGTVLANEEVTADGRSERGNFPVFKRNLKQWMMRITAYADRLLDDLDALDWPEPVKLMQRNWIGRSTGAHVDFPIDGAEPIRGLHHPPGHAVRRDLHGAGAGARAGRRADRRTPGRRAPGRPGPAGTPTPGARPSPRTARAAAAQDRRGAAPPTRKEKTGVFTGAYATNPVNGAQIPVFVADYVLAGYGTGAIMAVPGQDERDWEFAEVFDLPIVRTVQPPDGFDGKAYTGRGPGRSTAPRDGLAWTAWASPRPRRRSSPGWRRNGHGAGRDHLPAARLAVQPAALLGRAVPDRLRRDRPADRAARVDAAGRAARGGRLLAATFDAGRRGQRRRRRRCRAAQDWVEVELDLGDGPKRYTRETNTMPQWAGSCWYELRYLDPHNDEGPGRPGERGATGWARSRDGDSGGVDLYVGGVEHAVLHLLYARFWHKVLFDLGHVSSFEPFRRLFNQGYIQAYAYTRRPRRATCRPRRSSSATAATSTATQEVNREYGKMGKSLKNVVTPDEMCEAYGADTFRVYEMSMGPLDVSRPWETRAVVGSHRFLQRVWRLVVDEETGAVAGHRRAGWTTRPARLLHRTIDGVRADMDGLRFNTAIAKLIELTNALTALAGPPPREVVEPLVLMMAPFAPHLAEELWQRLGHDDSLAYADFPVADPALLVAETVTYPVQVNGKVRGRVEVAADAAEDDGTGGGAGRGRPRTWPAGSRARSSSSPAGWSASSPSSVGPDRAGSLPWRSGPSPRP